MGNLPIGESSLLVFLNISRDQKAEKAKIIQDPVYDPNSEETIFKCLEATGMRHWEALGHISVMIGQCTARREWQAALDGGMTTPDTVKTLDELAISSPDFAQELLSEWLGGRHLKGDLCLNGLPWIRSLPENLTVDGDLGLIGCIGLEHLGANTTVGGSVGLLCCNSLSHLPSRLSVGSELDIRSCPKLSSLPPDLNVGGDLQLWPGIEVPVRVMVRGRIFLG